MFAVLDGDGYEICWKGGDGCNFCPRAGLYNITRAYGSKRMKKLTEEIVS